MHTYWNTRTYTEAPFTLRYLDHHSCSTQQQGVQSSTVALVSQKLPDCFLNRSSDKSELSPTAHVFPDVHSGQHSELWPFWWMCGDLWCNLIRVAQIDWQVERSAWREDGQQRRSYSQPGGQMWPSTGCLWESHLTCATQESAVLRTYIDTDRGCLSYHAELQAPLGNLKGGVMKG